MKEKILIDGVNVAGCLKYDKDTGYCKDAFKPEEEPYCQCFTCEYKQLKQFEKENKKLKEEIKDLGKFKEFNYQAPYVILYRNLKKEIYNLEKENEELKKQIDLDAECIANYMKNATNLKKENEKLKNKNYTLKGAFDFQVKSNGKINEFRIKYRHALEEIREMTKSVRYLPQERFELIKDIINKVLESENLC